MISQLSLKHKNDLILINDTKALVAQEREVLSDFLYHLREIENRRLYLKSGYPSLFSFMTQELGYGESAAGRRIQAMRLIKDVPEVEDQIKTGKISLSVAAQMQSFFRQENKKRQSEEQSPISQVEKLEFVSQLAGTSSRQCEQKLAQISPETALPKEKARPITPEKTQIQFLADKGLLSKIQRLKELTSHQNPEGSFEKLFAKAVDMALEQLDPERKELRRQSRRHRIEQRENKKASPAHCSKSKKSESFNNSPSLPTSTVPRTMRCGAETKTSRHIPNALRDRIWVRDKGQCQYLDPLTQRQCGSRHSVQIDHRYPFSLIKEHSGGNLRLLCSAHNRQRWEDYEKNIAS